MAPCTSQCQDGDEVLKGHEGRCQGIKRCFRKPEHTKNSENSELKSNLSSKRSREGQQSGVLD